MNINCVEKCHYQHDGKCTLHEVPAVTNNTAAGTDCPYFSGVGL